METNITIRYCLYGRAKAVVMVALFDYESFFEDSLIEHEETELDLTFLEAMESSENLFRINKSFYETLENLSPKRQLVPNLHESIFEERLDHAVWTNNNWPSTAKHFPA